jgi:hypothetical protein
MTAFRAAQSAVSLAVTLIALASCADSNGLPPAGAGGTGGSSGGSGGKVVVQCDTVAPRACNFPELTYTNDIKPIIDDVCLSCHLGEEDGPWELTSYEHVASWHDLLRSVMLSCEMPPPEERITMTTEERQLLLEWLRCGYPE